MKNAYRTPLAKKIKFDYEPVVATSGFIEGGTVFWEGNSHPIDDDGCTGDLWYMDTISGYSWDMHPCADYTKPE